MITMTIYTANLQFQSCVLRHLSKQYPDDIILLCCDGAALLAIVLLQLARDALHDRNQHETAGAGSGEHQLQRLDVCFTSFTRCFILILDKILSFVGADIIRPFYRNPVQVVRADTIRPYRVGATTEF